MQTSKYIQLREELQPYIGVMGKAADKILDEDISKYPIFVIHKQEIELGISLISKGLNGWSVNASTLEEFVSKHIIEMKKLDSFKTIYKDPRKKLCLFVLSEIGANFIFLPRVENKSKQP